MTRILMASAFAVFMLANPAVLFAAEQAPQAAAEEGAAAQQPDAAKGAETAPAGFPLDEQMLRAKKNYDEAVKGLTPAQLAELDALDAEFASTMEIDMQILQRAAQMEHCLAHDAFFKADRANVQSFVTWRDAMKTVQEKRQSLHKAKRLKIKYVKPFVLDRYYVVYQTRVLKMLGMSVARNAYDQGMYKDTNCDDLSKRLKNGL